LKGNDEKHRAKEWLGYKSTKGRTGRKQMLANAMARTVWERKSVEAKKREREKSRSHM
jgi:hypothetical protein